MTAMAMTAAVMGQETPWSWNTTNMLNAVIPANNPSGFANTMAVSGLTAAISNVTVNLNISGVNGYYNGDLYGYLAGPNGVFAVLLNRVGVNGSSQYGYSGSGFDITLNDSGSYNNVHYYQTNSPVYNGSGQLTGIWASDGENVDPQGNLVGSSPSTATLSSFTGDDANGTWTLFLADLSVAGQATVVSWSLDITTVPEPQTWVLLTSGLMLFIFIGNRRGEIPSVNK